MAGNYTITSHALRQAGIIEVFDINELSDFLRGFSKTHSCADTTGGTGIITFSGAGGIVTSDLLFRNNLPVAQLSQDTFNSLQEVFPKWMPPSHPADIWPAIELHGYEKVYKHVITTLMHDDNVDSLIVHLYANRMDVSYLREMAELKDTLGKPVLGWATGNGKRLVEFRRQLEDIGIPVFDEMIRGVNFIHAVKQHFNKKGTKKSTESLPETATTKNATAP